jgi:hypothetical protein
MCAAPAVYAAARHFQRPRFHTYVMHPPGARAMADATAHSLDPGTLEEKGGSSLGGGRRGSVNNTNNDLSQPFMVASSVMVPSVDSRRAPAAAAAASPAAEPRRCFMPGENPAGDPSKIGECASIVGCFLNLAAPGAGTFCLSCIGGSWRGVRYGLATLLLFAALFVFPFRFLWAIITNNIGSPPVLLYVWVICSLALAFLVYLYNLAWTYKTATSPTFSLWSIPRLTRGEAWVCGCLNILPIPGAHGRMRADPGLCASAVSCALCSMRKHVHASQVRALAWRV